MDINILRTQGCVAHQRYWDIRQVFLEAIDGSLGTFPGWLTISHVIYAATAVLVDGYAHRGQLLLAAIATFALQCLLKALDMRLDPICRRVLCHCATQLLTVPLS